MNDIARQFEEGVQLHMEHLTAFFDLTAATHGIGRIDDELVWRANEVSGKIMSLEFSVPGDIFDAMHAEACDRLRQNSQRK